MFINIDYISVWVRSVLNNLSEYEIAFHTLINLHGALYKLYYLYYLMLFLASIYGGRILALDSFCVVSTAVF